MKCIFLIFFFGPFVVLAQRSDPGENNPDNLKDKRYELSAELSAPQSIRLPFSSIKIIDERFDTSKIGFVYTAGIFSSKKKSYKKFKLEQGVAGAIENYYNDYYEKSFTNTGFELLIVIKKLWFSNFNLHNASGFEITKVTTKGKTLLCKWEYYVGKNGSYLPAKRVDTAFEYTEAMIKNIEDESEEKKLTDFKFFLKGLIEIYDFEKAIGSYETAPRKTLEQIQAYNRKRFDIPVVKDSVFTPGVYLNFAEFRMNRPSVAAFTEKKTKYRTSNAGEYLEDANGNTINPYWGYSSKEEFKFGKYGHEKIFRVNKTFEFFSKVIWFYTSSSNGSIPRAITYREELWIPMQIDMETGEIY